MKQLIDFFQDKKVNNILDVGTGSGDFISILQKVFSKVRITGIDPETESLIVAQKKYPDVSFREMKAERIDYDANTFDVVSISMALHHLPEIDKSLHEMQRVVNFKGWLIISELVSDNLNPAQEVHKLYHHFRSAIHRIQGISHNETFTKDEILLLIRNAGIEILFNFDYVPEIKATTAAEIEERVGKMREMLEQISEYPEYNKLKSQIEVFLERALKFGIQPATKVIVVGRKNN